MKDTSPLCRSERKVVLSLDMTNFWDINPQLKKNGISVIFPRLRPEPVATLFDRFTDYKLAIKEKISFYNGDNGLFLYVEFDKKVDDVLKKFQEISRNNLADDKALLRLLGVISGHAFIGPKYFHLDITNQCNLDCVYCWFHSVELKNPPSYAWKKQKIPYPLFKKVVDNLAELKADTILFSGAGEPFMHPEIISMIQYVNKQNLKLQIFSNGTLINEKAAEAIIESKVDEIFISPSAADAITYLAVHTNQNKETFFRLENNIKTLLKYKGDRLLPKIFNIFVLNTKNYKTARQMLEWSNSLGIKNIRFQLAHNDDAKEIELDNSEREWLRNEMQKVKDRAGSLNINIDNNIFLQLSATEKSTEWYTDIFSKGCYVGWYFSRLWADGNISFCCIDKTVKKLDQKDSFEKLWNSEFYRTYRMAARKYDPKNNPIIRKNYLLIDKDCSHCGNMEVNEDVYTLLKKFDLLQYIA